MKHLNAAILEELHREGHITTQRIIELGFSKMMLTKYVKAGLLTRVANGVYIMTGEQVDEVFLLSLRSKHIVMSHTTALYLHRLYPVVPNIPCITIPSDVTMRREVREQCSCFYVPRELHSLGKIRRMTLSGQQVWCYDLERTICDYIRNRDRFSEEFIMQVLERSMASRKVDLMKLTQYAGLMRVTVPLQEYLQALL